MSWGKKKESTPVAEVLLDDDGSQPEITVEPDMPPTTRLSEHPRSRHEPTPVSGKSICFRGELSGDEDLTVEGSVEGKIDLKDNVLVVGVSACITAEVHARTVIVHGKVNGNITATDKVEITATGSVRGDVKASRVVLMENGHLKGNIDTGDEAQPAPPPVRVSAPVAKTQAHSPVQEKSSTLKALDWGESKPKA